MCDEGPNCAQDEIDQTDYPISLTDLPIEIFLHICSFLDASTLVHCLSLVCKQFREILNYDSLWKVRISQFWPDTSYPVLPPDEDDKQFWKLSCVALEKQSSLWKGENTMEKLSLSNMQFSTIDGLLLMENGNICISGARERSLVCWKLPTTENEVESTMCIDGAHDGWIWDLAAIDNTVYSCSWDRRVKAWALISTGLLHLKTYDIPISGALLCVATCADLELLAIASFYGSIYVLDPRTNLSPVAQYQSHRGAVVSLAMDSNYVLSASEDGRMLIWDLRAKKRLKFVDIWSGTFPRSICMRRNMIYVGDGNAKVHLLDPKKDFAPVRCYTTEHRKGINSIHCTRGCMITSSTDKTVRICSPTDPPHNICTLESVYGEIAGTDYLNDVLAVSGAGGIEIWRPKLR